MNRSKFLLIYGAAILALSQRPMTDAERILSVMTARGEEPHALEVGHVSTREYAEFRGQEKWGQIDYTLMGMQAVAELKSGVLSDTPCIKLVRMGKFKETDTYKQIMSLARAKVGLGA